MGKSAVFVLCLAVGLWVSSLAPADPVITTMPTSIPEVSLAEPQPLVEKPASARVTPRRNLRGETAINPTWQWIKVKNPEGMTNGNGFHGYDESAGIQEGGKLSVIEDMDDQVLVGYHSPDGQGYGSEAGNGTIFLMDKEAFLQSTALYEQKAVRQEEEKAQIRKILEARK